MIQVICDACGDDTGEINDDDWRTIVIDLGYLPGSHKHGGVDGILQLVLCHLCVEGLDYEVLERALKTAVLRRDT
jgi:hypothetical protein